MSKTMNLKIQYAEKALLLRALFNLYEVEGGRSQFLLRSLISLAQFPPAMVIALLSTAYYKLFKSKKVDFVIGPIDVQANILNIKKALGARCVSVNIRYQTKGFRYKGIWNKEIFKQYDYSIPTEYIGRLFVAPLLFGWLLGRTNSIVYVSDAGFFAAKIRALDYLLLSIFKRKIYSFFTGCDARARIPMMEFAKKIDIVPMCKNCNLKCAPSFRGLEAKIHERYNTKIFNSIDQTGYIKNFISFDSISFPFIDKSEFNFNFIRGEKIRIIHAANNKSYRFSDEIEAVFKRLDGLLLFGRTIEARSFYGINRDRLLEEMRDAHIYVSSLTGLIIGLASIEASARGCILLSGASKNQNPDLPKDYPGISVNANNLEEVLMNLCRLDFSELESIAQQCFDYAYNYHVHHNAGRRLRELLS